MIRKPSASPARGGRRSGGTTVALLLVLLAASASAPTATAADDAENERFSHQRPSTRWAHPKTTSPIRRHPEGGSRRIAAVHKLTEDGFPEVYLVLRAWSDPSGRGWFKVRIPMRPHGRVGWVRDHALGRLHPVRTRLVIDRQRRRATLYREGRRIWRSPVGIGKRRTPTPAGRFWIRERIKVGNSKGMYGPWAFGTSAYSRLSDWPGGGVIGIHGTNQPDLIPGRPSHGCIRVPNGAIKRLARRMPLGTAVRIR